MPQRPDKDEPADPSLMAETLADAPAIRPVPPTSGSAEVGASDPALDDTAVDYEPLVHDPKPRPVANTDVALDEVFDKPDPAADAASLTRFDPERGKTNVAIKIRAVTEAVRNTITTPFGKLMLSIAVALVGVTLTIAAITLKDTPYVIAAIVLTPVGALLVYWRYQSWLGHKRYMYRLLESLGEDVSEFDPRRIYRRAGTTTTTKKRR